MTFEHLDVDRASLNEAQRSRAWRALSSRTYDVVVIGGGVTGAGVALDAASRGLSVALVEARDLASGTSSRSGKIFHGGLRYLEQLNFGLVREALVERDLMVERLCPYLVRPVKFLIPLTRVWERPYVGAGVALYDLLRLTGPRSTPGHRHLSRRATLREIPDLRAERVRGGVQYYDVRVDDARHTMTVARTAARLGCDLVTRAEAVAIRRDAGSRVAGVRVRDQRSGAEIDVSARTVVNATGVWAEQTQRLAAEHGVSVTPSMGAHIMVPGDRINARSGLIARAAGSVFIIRQWFDSWLLGTTDAPWHGSLSDPVALDADVDFLLGEANRWLRQPLARADVIGVYAGLRPLVTGTGDSTAGLSRDHAVLEGPPGLITVVGGKYTTYRVMARDVVDTVGRQLARSVPTSATDTLPIFGVAGWSELGERVEELAAETAVPAARIERLLGRYGGATTALFDLIGDRPELAESLPGAPGYVGAEVVYAAEHEGATKLEDVMMRRTRIAIESTDAGSRAAARVADLMGGTLGWSDARRADEVAAYKELAAVERGAVDGRDADRPGAVDADSVESTRPAR